MTTRDDDVLNDRVYAALDALTVTAELVLGESSMVALLLEDDPTDLDTVPRAALAAVEQQTLECAALLRRLGSEPLLEMTEQRLLELADPERMAAAPKTRTPHELETIVRAIEHGAGTGLRMKTRARVHLSSGYERALARLLAACDAGSGHWLVLNNARDHDCYVQSMVFPDGSVLVEASGSLTRDNSDLHEALITAGYEAPIDTETNYQCFLERSTDLTTVATLVLHTLKSSAPISMT